MKYRCEVDISFDNEDNAVAFLNLLQRIKDKVFDGTGEEEISISKKCREGGNAIIGLTSLIRSVTIGRMSKVYSTYEAKAKFSEILRKVRAGGTVRISYHGEEVAEVRPLPPPQNLEGSLRRMEKEGVPSHERTLIDWCSHKDGDGQMRLKCFQDPRGKKPWYINKESLYLIVL